jgi:hypothetical protein
MSTKDFPGKYIYKSIPVKDLRKKKNERSY